MAFKQVLQPWLISSFGLRQFSHALYNNKSVSFGYPTTKTHGDYYAIWDAASGAFLFTHHQYSWFGFNRAYNTVSKTRLFLQTSYIICFNLNKQTMEHSRHALAKRTSIISKSDILALKFTLLTRAKKAKLCFLLLKMGFFRQWAACNQTHHRNGPS